VKQDTGAIQIVADGRFDWTGWVELSREEFKGEAVLNTGRVIQLVNADVQLLVEVEDRSSLAMFNRQVLGEVLGMTPYAHNLLVDGNDPRGIDLGLLSRFPIEAVRPHFADRDTAGETIFSRDCPEFAVQLPNGETLWVLGNHFKSKGYGNWRANNRKREAQAERAAELYQAARQRSPWVIVAGDLNDLPDSDPLRPLIAGTDLCDVMTHPTYSGLPGTYETCTAKKKIDYVLLSPALWERVKAVGVERSGIYAPRTFASMPTVTSKLNAASDHASVWVDLEF
jgi:endonuclease/exonuclease/phosphatase family metal-dependent hydrolase